MNLEFNEQIRITLTYKEHTGTLADSVSKLIYLA